MRPRDAIDIFCIPCAISASSGEGGVCGSGGNSSLSISGLDDGGEAGSGPKYCCDKSISLALSDLCTPDRNPIGREDRVDVGTWTTAISPRNRALILFSICLNGAPLVPSLSSSSSSIGGANSRRGVEMDVESPKVKIHKDREWKLFSFKSKDITAFYIFIHIVFPLPFFFPLSFLLQHEANLTAKRETRGGWKINSHLIL